MTDNLIEWMIASVILVVIFTFKWASILMIACVYAALSLTGR